MGFSPTVAPNIFLVAPGARWGSRVVKPKRPRIKHDALLIHLSGCFDGQLSDLEHGRYDRTRGYVV